jgi:hypothetical protein
VNEYDKKTGKLVHPGADNSPAWRATREFIASAMMILKAARRGNIP